MIRRVREDLRHSITSGKGGVDLQPGQVVPPDVPQHVMEEWEACGYLEDAEELALSPAEARGEAPTSSGSVSIWRRDPLELAELTLAQLNIVAKTMAPDIEPFETAEEARAYMSQDFQG